MYSRIGKMRHKISIKSPTGVQNTFGEPFIDNTTGGQYLYQNIWASVEPLIGKEFYDSKKIQSEATLKIRVRYMTGIESDMLIEHNSKKYQVVGNPINPEESNRELIIMCKEVT
jgi:SPP1 family predicted phage head-tail adaptor